MHFVCINNNATTVNWDFHEILYKFGGKFWIYLLKLFYHFGPKYYLVGSPNVTTFMLITQVHIYASYYVT